MKKPNTDEDEERFNSEGGVAAEVERQRKREEQEAKEAKELEAMRNKESKK